MEVRLREVVLYQTETGDHPFSDWRRSVRDPIGQIQIEKRLLRLTLGLLGEWDDVGEGVIELKFKNQGPGYRIYCGQDGDTIVVLLWGGTKKRQQSDIETAKEFWRDYKET